MGIAQLLLVGVLPAALLFAGVTRFILHHFFVRAPYLLDSGSNSAVVFHAGLFPHNAAIACSYAPSYYGVHFSPLVSLFSLLSYLSPVGRIEWYAFVAALVFVPIGLAIYALSALAGDRVASVRTLPTRVLAALSFALSGQVLWLIDYPHFEVAIPGLVCLTLAAVVTGRRRLAWLFLVLAGCVREDGGFHTALALLPVLYLSWRGARVRSDQRTIVRMIVVAICVSVLAIVLQAICFHSADLLRVEYLGDPMYGHVSISLLLERARHFIETRQVIYYPLVGTVLVAVLCRDARYLLGWAAAVPWFLLNLTAHQDEKGSFALYTGFPFVVSMFWVYLYGAVLAPTRTRLRRGAFDVVFALICASSTLGFYRAAPVVLTYTVKEMAYSPPMDRSAVHGFVDALATHRAELGRLYVDSAVAALGLESLRPDDVWHPGVVSADTIAFHHDTWAQADELLPALVADRLSACTHIIGTGIFVCAREPISPTIFAGLPTEQVPSVLVFATRYPPTVDRYPPPEQHTAMNAHLGRLSSGTYELTLRFAASLESSQVVELAIRTGSTIQAVRRVPFDAHVITARFVADGRDIIWFRLSSALAAPLVVTGAELQIIAMKPQGNVPG